MVTKQFGGKLSNELKLEYARSVQWNGSRFRNLKSTKMDMNFLSIPKLLKEQYDNRKEKAPKNLLPIVPFDKNKLNNDVQFAWFGHSTVFVRMDSKNILIDPMFGENASPIAPFSTKRFSENTLTIIDQLPQIDVVLITHDHYDHLDYASILKLIPKTKYFCVALGVGRHLEHWGVPKSIIKEFDWWEELRLVDLTIVFTPTQHFSGRGIKDRAKSLWGGWALLNKFSRIYFSGDGGYNSHFKNIGEKYGPFDIGFMECGQYNKRWHAIHMYPEESLQASIDAKVNNAIPVHWAGFSLSLHPWKEPIDRFVMEADKLRQQIFVPKLGELRSIKKDDIFSDWWNEVK